MQLIGKIILCELLKNNLQVHEHIKVALALFSAHILFKRYLMERKISVSVPDSVVRGVVESFVLLPVRNLSQDGA